MNNFLTRTLTGALFVIVMVGCIWWNLFSMSILFLFISMLGLYEFYSLLENSGNRPSMIYGVLLGLILFTAFFLMAYGRHLISFRAERYVMYLTCAFFLLLYVIFFVELFRKKEKPFQNVALTLLGVLYVVVPFSLLMCLGYKSTYDPETETLSYYYPMFILAFFFLVWTNDTFAYLVGRAIGRTKFFERISPKKTWEGTIGGLIFTLGTAYILSIYIKEISLNEWLIIGGIVSVTATLGDLVESMFKRSINVKDSGGILPGHGGILDRFDGVLLSAPFVCIYMLLIR